MCECFHLRRLLNNLVAAIILASTRPKRNECDHANDNYESKIWIECWVFRVLAKRRKNRKGKISFKRFDTFPQFVVNVEKWHFFHSLWFGWTTNKQTNGEKMEAAFVSNLLSHWNESVKTCKCVNCGIARSKHILNDVWWDFDFSAFDLCLYECKSTQIMWDRYHLYLRLWWRSFARLKLNRWKSENYYCWLVSWGANALIPLFPCFGEVFFSGFK